MKMATEKTTYTVRNNRTYYPEDQRPSTADFKKRYTEGATKTEVSQYQAFGDKDAKPSTKTAYYDKDGKLQATVFDINDKDMDNNPIQRTSIQTPDANYDDWDNDGKIDSKTIDKTYTREIAPKKKSSNNSVMDGLFSPEIKTQSISVNMNGSTSLGWF